MRYWRAHPTTTFNQLISTVILLLLLPCVVATAQDPPAALNVVGAVPLPGGVLCDQIVVFFDKPVVLPPGPDGKPQPPLTTNPPIEAPPEMGSNYIAYHFPELDNTAPVIYDIALNPSLQSSTGQKLNPEQQHWSLPNVPFEATRTWVIESKPEQTVLGMLFPFPVAPDALKNSLTLAAEGGGVVAFSVEQGTDERTCRIVIPGAVNPHIRITVAAGLPDRSGRIKVAAPRIYNFPSIQPFSVVSASWSGSVEGNEISIEFNKDVLPVSVKEHTRIIDVSSGDEIEFELPDNVTDPVRAVPFNLQLPSSDQPSIEVTVSADLEAVDGSPLAGAFTAKLERKPGNLAIQDTWFQQDWEHLGRDGLILQVNFSRSVKGAELKDRVTLTPPLENMRLEPRGRQLRIHGDWNSKTNYELQIALPQGALKHRLKTEMVPAYAGFDPQSEYYFPRRTGLALPLKTRNLDKVALSLHRMFPSNIAVALNDMRDGRGSMTFNESWSEQVSRVDIPIMNRTDRTVDTPVDLDKIFPQDRHGVFCLTADGTDTQATKVVLLTNIGLLSYWQKDDLVLFAHDLFSLAPLPMAKIRIYSQKNQLIGSGNTNSDGIAHLGPFDPALGEPRVAVVEREDDYSFLELSPREEDNRAFTPDMPPYDRHGYDAFLYADRDLYRPGETVHAHWLVRTNYGDALPNVPLMATVLKPNGRNLLTQPTTLSDFGTGGIDVPTERIFPTGKYTVQLAVPGSKKTIGTYQFSLEDFVPNRIKTTVTLNEPVWHVGKDYAIHANAQHLFGAPAANRKCEATVIFRRDAFAPEAWKTYRFGNDTDFLPAPVPCGEQMTDANGDANFTFTYKPPAKVTFPMRAFVVARTFELGGRPVAAKAETMYFPSDICLGAGVASAKGGDGVDVFAAAVTPGDKPEDAKPAALDKVKIALERQVWNYYVRRYYSNYEPKWSESFEPIEEREVPLVDGRATITFNALDYGYYRVRVFSEATPQYSTVSFYSYGTGCQEVSGARPSLIKVTLDKESYVPGETAEIRIESPFDGKGIVVLQGGEIQEMIPVDIQNKVGVVRYIVTSKQVPNVWVEATVIHAVKTDKKQVYPFSSFAMTNMKVQEPQRALAVTFANLPQEIRPATDATFTLDVRDSAGNPAQAELTLAAVDEGIHAISDYQNPDPLKWLSRPRQPDFRRAHYYDKVAYDFEKPAIGGDALLRSVLKRVPGADENWIKPVALWSGSVRADAAGHATITMPVPEFTGQLRLVAVACTPGAVGEQSGNIFVRRPFILRTSLPRFLQPNDTVQCRASVFNNSDAACKARVTWEGGGTVTSAGGTTTIDVPPHGETALAADFAAGPLIGQGEITWTVAILDAAGQEVDHVVEKNPMPVRPPAAFQSQTDLAVVKPGETREFKNAAFVEDERLETEIAVGATPLLRLQKALKFVAGYPYGCIEQTTSKLMPMYLLRQASTIVSSAIGNDVPVDSYIQSGIVRLFSMQTTEGGLGMWPGDNKTYPYGSVYALHFLTLVKRDHSFDLPEPNFEALQKYVRGLTGNWLDNSPQALFLRAYALYVLALSGDLDAIQQIQRFDTVKLPTHARMLLAAALAENTKDTDRVKMYLSNTPSEPFSIAERSGTLNSDMRNTAIELMALRQMNAAPEVQLEKVKPLLQFLELRSYTTTQETAFVITALAGYFADLAAAVQNAGATIKSPDKEETLTGPSVWRAERKGPGAVYTVANTGTADLYVTLTTRGLPLKPETAAISRGGLNVKRKFFMRTGAPYTEPTFNQTDSYVVDLEITTQEALENVIVADLLPAGLEIENPRLDPDTLPGGKFKGAATASNIDVRDDRLLLAFEALKAGQHHFYYVARAVTAGTYQYPPVQAECMYDATIFSRSEMGNVTVKGQ